MTLASRELAAQTISFYRHILYPTIRPMKSSELFDLSGHVAVVIGATGALGGALAEGLGSAGAKVALLGRNAERGNARVKTIQSKGGQASFFSADATSQESLHAAHQAIEKSLGAPAILINAAGGT